MEKPMIVVVYVRLASVSLQDHEPLAAQMELAKRYCSNYGLTICRFYHDPGVSGLAPLDQRPGGKLLVADARLRKFDHLLVSNLDRLGRAPWLVLKSVAELEFCRVTVHGISEELASTAAAQAKAKSGSAR
jgi:site-specific DNA recombinase